MTDRPDMHQLTGAYALDALPDDERESFEQHLLACGPCAREVVELQATAARLGDAAFELPSPSLRDRVLAEVDATRQLPPFAPAGPDAATDGDRGVRAVGPDAVRSLSTTGLRVATGVLGVAAAVLAVVVVGLSSTVGSLNAEVAELEVASGQVTDLLASDDVVTVATRGPDGSLGRVVASPSSGEAVFLASGMAPAPHAHTYELWVIGAGGPVPAGLFDPDDDGRVTTALSGDLAGAAAIGVTVEPAGGSPQPTSDPIMVLELG